MERRPSPSLTAADSQPARTGAGVFFIAVVVVTVTVTVMTVVVIALAVVVVVIVVTVVVWGGVHGLRDVSPQAQSVRRRP